MAYFIVDMNVPVKSHQDGYPKYFFEEMNSTSRHHVFFGGTKYLDELRKREVLQRIFIDWITSKKATRLVQRDVDDFEEALRNRVLEKLGNCPGECDDFHIFAIASVSGCRHVISYDQRMSACKKKIRNKVGHEHCPDLKLIKNESAYRIACNS